MQPIKSAEKSGILYRVWDVTEPQALVVLVHGLCSHSGRWEFLAETFKQAALATYAIELQGFGATTGHPGHIPSFFRYYADVMSLIAVARHEHPGKKVFLLGESMGGLITFIMASIVPPVADGVICFSPSFKDKLQFGKGNIAKIIFAMLYNRRKTFHVPFTAEMCTRDAACQSALDNDRLAPKKASAQMLGNILVQQHCARSVVDKISMPVLIQLAGSDSMVDATISKKIFRSLPLDDKTLIDYPEHVHALSIDSGRELVFEDTIMWITRHV
jgi:alpha-beta hydrolase superfamily lysophospholipase